MSDGPDKLWVADITYVPIIGSFVYVAVILDAWSRRVVGYVLGRFIDARLAIAALNAAIQARQPRPGCVHHSDRGSRMMFTAAVAVAAVPLLLLLLAQGNFGNSVSAEGSKE